MENILRGVAKRIKSKRTPIEGTHPSYIFIVMDAVSEHVRRNAPWDMLYADDLIAYYG